MAIAINGTGTITGISVGGLNDSIITSSELANAAVTAAKLGTNTFVSYAILNDTKSSGTPGGTFTSGDWRTRDLNTEVDDPDGIVSIASNQFTLGAGSYLIRWSATAFFVDIHQTRLYDITNAAALALGSSEYASNTYFGQTRSFGSDRVTISTTTVYEIQHRCEATKSTNGFGVTTVFGDSNVYTEVEIFKEA